MPALPTLGAHLVGSVPFANAERVFRTLGSSLGAWLDRIPDGETGERINWVAWQYPVLARNPALEPVPVGDRGYLRRQLVQLRAGARQVHFPNLGYADAAIDSYAIFERMRRERVIPDGVRFQVSLPTPLAPLTVFVRPEDRAVVEPAYETRLLEEVDLIAGTIPHADLAIQWDTAVEVAYLEGTWPAHFPDLERGIAERMARIGNRVPIGVDLGFHLCYGDFGHRHFMQPADASKLVNLANAISARVRRPIQWIHMPVPLPWADPAPFAPFARLDLQERTRVFLGVVHVADGISGALRRIELAAQKLPAFGVATECGWGRRPPETISALIRIHTSVTQRVR